MDIATVLNAILTMGPVEIILSILVFGYLFLKTILKIPTLVNYIKKLRTKPTDKEKSSPLFLHKGCKNLPSLLQIIEHAMQVSDEIVRIKYIDTIYDQMSVAEESWRRIRLILRENYIKLLVKTGLSDIKQQEAKRIYHLVLDSLGREILGNIRKWMKRNHFLEKSEIEFQVYVEERSTDLEEIFSIAIEDIFVPTDLCVSREELRKSNLNDAMPIVLKEIVSFFSKVRKIAREKQDEINELKELLPL